jgi:uncharacterized protein (DUF302 family)
MNDLTSPEIFQHKSAFSFQETVDRLTAAIENAGMTIFAKIDHASSAQSVGLLMPPATVLIYGNPKVGTKIMLSTPHAALDLPLRVLIHEHAHSGVCVAFHPVAPMLELIGVPRAVAVVLEPAQQRLILALQE